MATEPLSSAEFNLQSERTTSETIVHATGRITSTTSAIFESRLRQLVSRNKRVVLDLTNLDYIDSSGLGALVAVYMHAQRAKCDLEIANPKSRIKDLFSRSGLASVFRAPRPGEIRGPGENYFM